MADRGRRGPDDGPAARQGRPPPPPFPRRRRARGGGGSGSSRGRRGSGDGDRKGKGGTGGALARKIDVVAPAGKLGLQVDSNPEGRSAIVIRVKEGSPLLGSVRRGDGIVAVDDEDVSDLTPVQISMLLGSKSGNARRKITLLRPVAPDHEKSSDGGDTTSTAQTSRRSNASADDKNEASVRRQPLRDGAASPEKRRRSEGDAYETDGEYSLCESDSEFDKQWEKAREEKARGKKVVALVLEEDGTYSVIGKPEAKGKVKAKAQKGGGRRGRDRRPVRDAVSADRGAEGAEGRAKGGGRGRLCQSVTDRLVPPPPPPRPAPLCKSDSDRYDGGLSDQTCTTASSSKPSVDSAASGAAERGRASPTGGSDFVNLEQAQRYLSATRGRGRRASSATIAATRHTPRSPMPPSSDRGRERPSSTVVVHNRYAEKSADETSKASEVTNSSTAATRGRRASSEIVVDGRYAPNRKSSLRSSTSSTPPSKGESKSPSGGRLCGSDTDRFEGGASHRTSSTAGSRRHNEDNTAAVRGRRSSSEAAVDGRHAPKRKSSLRSSNNNIQQGESKSPTRGRLCESDTDRFDGGASCDTERSRSKSVTFNITSRYAEPKSPSPPSTVLAKYAPGFTGPSNSEARKLLEGSDPPSQDQTAPERGRRSSSAAAVTNRYAPKSSPPSSNNSNKTKRTESSSSQRAVARGRRASSHSVVSTDRYVSQSSNVTNQEGFDSSASSRRGRRLSSEVVGTERYAPKSPSPPSPVPGTSIITLKEPAFASSSQRQRADAPGRSRSGSASRRGRNGRLSSSDTKLEGSDPWSKDTKLERSSLSLTQDPAARRGRRASSEVVVFGRYAPPSPAARDGAAATSDASSSQHASAAAENSYHRKSSAPAQFPSSRSSSEVVSDRYARKPSAPSTGDEILEVLERLESFSTREGRSRANSPAQSSGMETRGSSSSYSTTGRLSSNSSRHGFAFREPDAVDNDVSSRINKNEAVYDSWVVNTAGVFISEEDASEVTLATPLQDPPVAGSSRGQSGARRASLSTRSEKGGAEAPNYQLTSSFQQRMRANSPAPAAATAAASAETSNKILTSSFQQRMRANSPAPAARDDDLFELKREDLKPGGIKIVLTKDSGSVRSTETDKEGRKGNLKRLRSIASSFSRRAGRR